MSDLMNLRQCLTEIKNGMGPIQEKHTKLYTLWSDRLRLAEKKFASKMEAHQDPEVQSIMNECPGYQPTAEDLLIKGLRSGNLVASIHDGTRAHKKSAAFWASHKIVEDRGLLAVYGDDGVKTATNNQVFFSRKNAESFLKSLTSDGLNLTRAKASRYDVESAYKARIKEFDGLNPPSRNEDDAWGLGRGYSTTVVRECRRTLAPYSWKSRGRKTSVKLAG